MTAPQASNNPLLSLSTLPYAFPDFAHVTIDGTREAILSGIEQHSREIDAIATSLDAPSFDNTMVALERSGIILDRALAVYHHEISTNGTVEWRALEAELTPVLTRHFDSINFNAALFARIDALFHKRETLGLEADALRLLERDHFMRSLRGAALDAEAQKHLASLNEEIATLTAAFAARVQADAVSLALNVATAAELDGLTPAEIEAAHALAGSRGEGGYTLQLTHPQAQPALARLTNRATRELLYRNSAARGSHGGDNDTRELVLRISRLRAERAEVLGFANAAEVTAASETAGNAAAIAERLALITPPAVARAREEYADVQAFANERLDAAGADRISIEAWDWQFYAGGLREQRFNIDETALRPYFESNRVLHDGVFFAASKLYGLSFTERFDLTPPHPEARIFEVFDESGEAIALFVWDLYARDTKRGGAWMTSFVSQSTLLETRPIIVNVLNVRKPASGKTYLTLDETTTVFHEFGHALHGMLSNVRYPSQSGTSVPRDFVEFPSQVNEMWVRWPEVLANYAIHDETGEALPADVLEHLEQAELSTAGWSLVEYLQAATLDQAWAHVTVRDAPAGVEEFQRDALEAAGLAIHGIQPRYSSAFFTHVFAGGYSGAYYSYAWSEVLDADTVDWFQRNGGLNRENGDRFRRELLSRGGSIDPLEQYLAFTGREAAIEPYLRRHGLLAS